jgi:ribonucleoside-diphosphate reductase alpha chain
VPSEYRARETGAPAPIEEQEQDKSMEIKVPDRPKTYNGYTYKYSTGCGNLYVVVNCDDAGHPREVFAKLGKIGGCPGAMLEALGRTLSVALRCGIPASEFVEQYKDIGCPGGMWSDGAFVKSCVGAVGLALERTEQEQPQKQKQKEGAESNGDSER